MRTIHLHKALAFLKTNTFLFLLISCSGYSTLDSPTQILEVPITDTPALPVVTPTSRIFEEPSNCDETEVKGHLLYLRRLDSLDSVDLYIMDGNACSQHLIMQNVSGKPDWSADGKRISVGCDNNKYICILDAPTTLDPCLKSSDTDSECTPVITGKYELPFRGEQTNIYSTSWSYDGTQLVVEHGKHSHDLHYVDLLTLSGDGRWKTLIESFGRKHPDMSPTKNEIVFDGIFVMPLDGSPIRFYINGWDASWSPDGEKIAFLIDNEWDENKEPIAIWEWNFAAEQHWRVLYEPPNLDKYYSSQNLLIGGSLSWSLDGRYLAFVAGRSDYESQIFRLDTKTGDIVILTTKFEEKPGYQPPGHFFAPTWGP